VRVSIAFHRVTFNPPEQIALTPSLYVSMCH
jgi:hypothetical protein